jgi:acetyl-CoA carboxylase carboxyl transferase subunit alpha
MLLISSSCCSVISPEGCASILYKDASKASTAAESLKIIFISYPIIISSKVIKEY